MKSFIIFCTCFFLAGHVFAQRYTTKGIEVYDKNLNGTYRLVERAAGYDATFGFYKDNTLVKVMEGDKVELLIKKKVRNGSQTTYTIDNYVGDIKIVVGANGILSLYTDSQLWRFRIVKTEKDID